MKESEPKPGGYLYCSWHRSLIGVGDARTLRSIYIHHMEFDNCNGEIYLLQTLPVRKKHEEIIKGGEPYE